MLATRNPVICDFILSAFFNLALTGSLRNAINAEADSYIEWLAVAVSTFPLSKETEIEENQEEDGMNNGAHAADLRCLNEARTQDRHRNSSQVEIEKNPRIHKESACEKLANALPWNPPEHIRLPFFPATTVWFDFKSVSSCVHDSFEFEKRYSFRPRAQRKEKQ